MQPVKFFGKTFQNIFLVIIGLEVLSLIAFYFQNLNAFFFLIIILVFLIVCLKKLEWGVYLLLAELFIGSKGYLLEFAIGDFAVSLRLGLFLALFLAWIIWVIKEKQITFFKIKLWKYYLAFMVILGIGILIGYLNNNPLTNIFFDWNGYLYFGLIFPLAQAINTKEKYLKLFQVLTAGVLASALKTIILLFLFSHTGLFLGILPDIYKWVRDTGVGEITELPNHFFRIFFQSHIYAVIFLFISFILINNYSETEKKIKSLFTKNIKLISTGFISLLIIFLSYSRSFWLGTFITFVLLFGFLFFYLKNKFSKVIISGIFLVGFFVLSVGASFIIINFPMPGGSGGVSAASLIKERTSDTEDEAAAQSRYNLIQPMLTKFVENPIFGSGFGTSIKYQSQDPRALESANGGLYETFSFEWGWLDFLLKIGILGTFVYLLLLFQIFKTNWQIYSKSKDPLILGLLFSLIAIIIIHAFTPYLNHPLGIGWILIVSLFPTLYSKSQLN